MAEGMEHETAAGNQGQPPAVSPAQLPLPIAQAPDAAVGDQAVPYARFQQVVGERNKLKADLETMASEHKKVAEAGATLQQALEAERAASLRLRVAVSNGLPVELADRLVGKTEDELRADASRLVPLLRPATPGVPPAASAPGQPARLDIRTMSPEEIRKHRDELMAQAVVRG